MTDRDWGDSPPPRPFTGKVRWVKVHDDDSIGDRVFGIRPGWEGMKEYFVLEQYDGDKWRLVKGVGK